MQALSLTRIYVAISADGFIAASDGSVDFLAGFDPSAYGYDAFSSQVGTIIMGRRTLEFTRAFGDWPYGDKTTFVVCSTPPADMPDNARFVRTGLKDALKAARAASPKDVWVVGGAATMRGCLDLGEVDLIELFVVPTLIGSGLPLLADLDQPVPMALETLETFQDGVVKLAYRPQNRVRA